MAALGFMRHLWKYIYEDLTILGKIVLFPSAIAMYSLLFIMAILEFFMLDIGYILMSLIEDRKRTIERIVYYLTLV